MRTNNQRGRIEIIDSELSRSEFVSTKKLVREIENNLDIVFCERTIQKDIELMKRMWPIGYSAPIEWDRKRKAYYYSDKEFTIQAFGLKEEDIKALLLYAKTLDQFKEIKIFKSVLDVIEKVVGRIRVANRVKKLIANKALFLTEKILISKGIEHIEPIIKALLENQKIVFDYKKFDESETNKRTLTPLLLKEDRNFWYVIGILEDKINPTTFALDRMSNLQVTNKYFNPPGFDTNEYFKYSFGITVSESKPIKIVLSFKPYQGNYVRALPIHQTQKIIRDTKKEFRVSVIVKPSYEFFSKVLSYGSDVIVISPKEIVTSVIEKLQRAYKNYS